MAETHPLYKLLPVKIRPKTSRASWIRSVVQFAFGITVAGQKRLILDGYAGSFSFMASGIRRRWESDEITRFLSALATERHVSASTQNQALSAILFLYRYVLNQEVPWLDDLVRAKRPHRLPVVCTRDEVKAVLDQLSGTNWLMAALLYGAGLRLLECLQLRIKDVDFGSNQIVVRDAKGNKDRITLLPAVVRPV